jgi:ribose-phosphate pyrophosphokinase
VTPLIVPGTAHRALAEEIARQLGAELADRTFERFPDGEQQVDVHTSLRGRSVYIVQPLGQPVGENLLDLLFLSDACHRAGAASIAAIVPYLGYARYDRVRREGQPLAAKVVAEALGTGLFSRLVALDLHSAVAAACIRAPLTHLTAAGTLTQALAARLPADAVVVSPDLGAVKLAETFARFLDLPLAVVHKTRISGSSVAVTSVMGEVRGKRPVLVDDLISTGGTLDAAVDALLARGCLPELTLLATHGLFAKDALARLSRPEVVLAMTTDSLPFQADLPANHKRVSIAPLLAESIRRLETGRSLDDLLAAW